MILLCYQNVLFALTSDIILKEYLLKNYRSKNSIKDVIDVRTRKTLNCVYGKFLAIL